ACVRGIVAASGFAPRTAETIDALHATVFDPWDAAARGGDTADTRRALLSRRYQEYEPIAQAGGAAGAHDVATRLGAPAAGRLGAAAAGLLGIATQVDRAAELLGSMHESLAEAVVSLLSGEAELPSDVASLQGVATPPLEGAWRIVERLEARGLECALGGSGL